MRVIFINKGNSLCMKYLYLGRFKMKRFFLLLEAVGFQRVLLSATTTSSRVKFPNGATAF